MVWAGIYFTSREWFWPGAALLVFAAGLMVWSYRGAALHGGMRLVCLGVKLAGLVALAVCLLEPLWIGQRAKPGANLFLVLADNSQSLQIKDHGADRTRGEQLRSWLTGEKSFWQDELEKNFQTRRFWFDARLQSARDFGELSFSGRASALHTALRSLGQRYEGRPVAGILLFTDGNATDLPAAEFDLSGLPPLYPVPVGGEGSVRDISIERVHVSQTAFEDAPVTIQADILAQGFAGVTLVAQLWAINSKEMSSPTSTQATSTVEPAPAQAVLPGVSPRPSAPLAELRQKVGRASDQLSFRFQIRPEHSGVSFYQVRAASLSELGRLWDPAVSTEATVANNARLVTVDRGEGPYRILYVSGRPNWEFKFLNRALGEDAQIQLVGLVRVAKREPRFEFKGRRGETSNPLFRGFDRKTEETEQYDQPVLIRINARDAVELSGGFPKSAEELFSYHAVVVDDLEAAFFTQDQMTLLHRFVVERGGGLLVLGGADSFQDGQYARTKVGDLLPVYLDQVTPRPAPQKLRLVLTRDGWVQPWTRLRNNESAERERLDAMPFLQVLNPVRSVKPGATVLATVADSVGQHYPALVAQRFGHGKTVSLLVGDFWRWGLREASMQQDLAKAWRQMIRWLVVDVPPFVGLQVQQTTDALLQSVRLQTGARQKDFQPLDNARVTVQVRQIGIASPSETNSPGASAPSGVAPTTERPGTRDSPLALSSGHAFSNAVQLLAELSATDPGFYEVTYVPRQGGAYLAEAVVLDNEGREAGRAQAGWTCDPVAEEFASLRPNRGLLDQVARKTGGRMIALSALDAFVKDLPLRQAPITDSWSFPLWHRAAVFLFALTCFVAEWGLRRFRGLA
jgi:uncharacterized membrane protein